LSPPSEWLLRRVTDGGWLQLVAVTVCTADKALWMRARVDVSAAAAAARLLEVTGGDAGRARRGARRAAAAVAPRRGMACGGVQRRLDAE
jgi:hypothetical protein